MEKTIFIIVITGVSSGLFTFFFTKVGTRKSVKEQIKEGIKAHTAICDEKFKNGSDKFEVHNSSIRSIQDDVKDIRKSVGSIATTTALIAGKLDIDIKTE